MPRLRKVNTSGPLTTQQTQDLLREASQTFQSLVTKIWVPHLSELLARDLESALGKDPKLSAQARERIYDRLLGKPTERRLDNQAINITLNVRPVSSLQEAEETIIETREVFSLPLSEREIALGDGGEARDRL